ncbi:glutamate decarboxylase [Monoraphidium neglectum]|uniref:glutamate decarboxylase n=1 Tax=Monoraphidium neglectum TaxID=145388 RepID=A0A0D2J4T5_9CHLO|nr:glutamate decarboxylase [Monoraphidium neglectum]KIY94947.1 glutamate decarboxylase [Monoraphidium neglectum]|eukprot:XP_013893967.1 glutamate decarboxylase [Monoraphidium neglectum]
MAACDSIGQATVTLNFSRGASHVIAQYFQLLRLGRDGYTRIMNNLSCIKLRLEQGILAIGAFEMLSKDVGVPLVAFRLKKRLNEHGDEDFPSVTASSRAYHSTE